MPGKKKAKKDKAAARAKAASKPLGLASGMTFFWGEGPRSSKSP